MPYVVTRAGRVFYAERGGGPPLLLLHATLHDHTDFDAVVPALAATHRTIAVDWPGHGRSDPVAEAGAPLLADVLEDVVDALDLPAAALIGSSVGGFAAARLAIRRPDRVAALVLVNHGGFLPQNPMTRAFSRLLGSARLARRVLPTFVRGYVRARGEFDRALRDRVVARARTADGVAVAAGLWRSFAEPGHDLRAEATSLAAPTLIVWGTKDTAIPLPLGRATYRRLPQARFVTLPTGHVPFASDPDGFLELVTPFLADSRSP